MNRGYAHWSHRLFRFSFEKKIKIKSEHRRKQYVYYILTLLIYILHILFFRHTIPGMRELKFVSFIIAVTVVPNKLLYIYNTLTIEKK